jgi:nitrous-oxide reductase
VLGANTSEIVLQPGETRTLTWIPKSPGVYPFYCTDFCSALHQEMQGYIRVSPAGSAVKLVANVSKRAQAQLAQVENGKAKSGR